MKVYKVKLLEGHNLVEPYQVGDIVEATQQADGNWNIYDELNGGYWFVRSEYVEVIGELLDTEALPGGPVEDPEERPRYSDGMSNVIGRFIIEIKAS